MTVSELGRSVQTPDMQGDTFTTATYMADRAYKAKLFFPDNIQDLVGSGSLVIQLEVDIREKEG